MAQLLGIITEPYTTELPQITVGNNNSGGMGREDGINQIGDENENDQSKSFTYRIPISVCALPCKVGEKKVMSTVRLSIYHISPLSILYQKHILLSTRTFVMYNLIQIAFT